MTVQKLYVMCKKKCFCKGCFKCMTFKLNKVIKIILCTHEQGLTVLELDEQIG